MPNTSLTVVEKPSFEFKLKNLNINFVGLSVSNPNDGGVYNTNLKDTVYILNKNNKSLYFKAVSFKDAVLRNRFLDASVKNLITTNTSTVKDGDSVKSTLEFQYKGNVIGRLFISYPYSYYIGENTLLLPFQSFPITAVYQVVDPGVLVKQYYGNTTNEPNRKTGTLDVNFAVQCLSREGAQVNEDITISVNMIDGGFVRNQPVLPDDGNGSGQLPAAGTLAGYTCRNGCNKWAIYNDGLGGFTYTDLGYDSAYCACTRPTAWRPKQSSGYCAVYSMTPSAFYYTLSTTNLQNYDEYTPNNPSNYFKDQKGTTVDLVATFWADANHTQPLTLVNQSFRLFVKNTIDGIVYNFDSSGNPAGETDNHTEQVVAYDLSNISGHSTLITMGVQNHFQTFQNENYSGGSVGTLKQLDDYTFTWEAFPKPDGLVASVPTGKWGYTTLEQYYTDDQSVTGNQKPNDASDPNYVAPAPSAACSDVTSLVTNVSPTSSLKVWKIRLQSSSRTQDFEYTTPYHTNGGVTVPYYMDYNQPTTVIVNMTTDMTTPPHPGLIRAIIQDQTGTHNVDFAYSDGTTGTDRNLGTFTNIKAINFSNNW